MLTAESTRLNTDLLGTTCACAVLVLAYLQEALDMRHDGGPRMARLHFAHTLVETAATLLIVLLLTLNTRTGYVKVRRAVERLGCHHQHHQVGGVA